MSNTPKAGRKFLPKPNTKEFDELLKLSNMTLLDIVPIKKGHNTLYKIRCNACLKEGTKASFELGKKKCQCIKGTKPSHNFKGYEDLSIAYFKRCKRGAKERKKDIEFSLTIEQMWEQFKKQDKKCALTGLPIVLHRNYIKSGVMTASLDRIDSDKGYTVDNIQWVQKDINLMKNHFNQDYFIEMCKKVANNND